jgi:uncharacterized protein (DUF2147 family)
MMGRSGRTVAVLILLASPVQATEPSGEWLVADKSARIRISPCGNALCGAVVWTRDPGGTDVNNPDPRKRSRPILGLEVLQSMRSVGPNRWEGNVYNSNDGGTYKAAIVAQSESTLRIEGCILGGLICGGENWSRVAPASAPKVGEALQGPSSQDKFAQTK